MIIPKHKPEIGPPNLEQNFAMSIEFSEPRADFVVICPFTETEFHFQIHDVDIIFQHHKIYLLQQNQ